MKKRLFLIALFAALLLGFWLGPTPETPHYKEQWPDLPASLQATEAMINEREQKLPLRPGNQADFVWAGEKYETSEYVFLYLHGFSASHREGYPVNEQVAAYFHQNLYLARLAGHGYQRHQLQNFTAEAYWESAVEALAIASQMGRKVIIMSTSTGSTVALKLAASFPDQVTALINLSPNIRIKNPAAFILNDPWGLQIARLVYGGNNRRIHHEEKMAPHYWDTLYPAEATVQLEELLETTMTEATFAAVQCPVLNLYYYKNEDEQDQIVDVSAIPPMHTALGTADSLKRIKALPSPGHHVIASAIKSKDWQVVEKEIIEFCREILGMRKPEISV